MPLRSTAYPDEERLRKALAALLDLGTREISHSGRSLLEHLVGTYNLLNSTGYGIDVSLAGLFHSIYRFKAPEAPVIPDQTRRLIRAHIGEKAETLVYSFSYFRHEWLDPILLGTANLGRDLIEAGCLGELLAIYIANGLEQLPFCDYSARSKLLERIKVVRRGCQELGLEEHVSRILEIGVRAHSSETNARPLRLIRMIPGLRVPERSHPTLQGSIPHRAALHCQPFLAANGFGWRVFSPLDADLLLEGDGMKWRKMGQRKWRKLDVVVHEESARAIHEIAPEFARKYARIPMLASAPERDIVQVWTGFVGLALAGWGLLLRPLVNVPQSEAFQVLEGVIETDWWAGPLVFPIRLLKSGTVVSLRQSKPLAQLQPVRKESLREEMLADGPGLSDIEEVTLKDWRRFCWALSLRNDSDRPGRYRFEAQRRKRELKHS
jgi:hypothetical protein